MKTCRKCGILFDGARCAACKKAYNAAYKSVNAKELKIKTKAWRAANPEKVKAFNKNWKASNSDKIKAYQAAWYAANTDKAKAYNVAYRAANTEKWKATQIAYRTANSDKIKAANASYRTANAKKISAKNAVYTAARAGERKLYMATYYATNPEHYRIYHQNRRARKIANGGSLSKGLSKKLFKLQRGKCACCGKPLGDNYHLDHIMPLALGGKNMDDNIQLLRASCNIQKHRKHPVDFMQSRGFLI